MKKIVIIGGGAAGFFGAIAAAQFHSSSKVLLIEKSRQLLSKVRISGGGRCNVTHACFDPAKLVQHYPRGAQALRGPFSRFQPKDIIAWFAERGVELKTERDGRIFPVTDSSETIIQCLLGEAKRLGVEILTEIEVVKIEKSDNFRLELSRGEPFEAEKILLATGSSHKAYKLAESLGHKIVAPVPSLFTFNITDPRLEGLAGVSVPIAKAVIAETDLQSTGSLLITHWGLSGPCILKLSAWGARRLHAVNYQTKVLINWLPEHSENELRLRLKQAKEQAPKKGLFSESLFALPKQLWRKLLIAAGIDEARLFAQLSKVEIDRIIAQLLRAEFELHGKSIYKEEFVTAGGIALDEVDFKTMQSRLCPGLFFAGEVLDIDGVTGGFNFQNAWTTAWLAAQAM